MATDPEQQATTRSQAPSTRRKSRHSTFWLIVGGCFAWIVAMSVVQKALTGYLLAFALMYAALALAGLALLARQAFERYAAPLCACGLLLAWWGLGGTYSWRRDAVVGAAACLVVLLAHARSRLWLRVLPRRIARRWRRWRARRRFEASEAGRRAQQDNDRRLAEAVRSGASSLWTRVRQDLVHGQRDAAPPRRPTHRLVRPALTPSTVAVAALAVWVSLSAADWLFESTPLPRAAAAAGEVPAGPGSLNIALALSGGGYRAALVHAGVVDALGSLGITVTHIGSVSGGSIIGSYLSVGGRPQDFRDAVVEGRFRMTRDLMAAPNLVRLPSKTRLPWVDVDLWPFFDGFSRLSVQGNLVDRVLLNGEQAHTRHRPRLLVSMTDLNHGLSVGATDDGVLLAGPTTERFFRNGQTIRFDALSRLADRVAVSGAFPGAFPTFGVQARIARGPGATDLARDGIDLQLQLADGGVRDNLGLSLLQAMDRLAREPVEATAARRHAGFRPDPDWMLDLILVSDGGKFLQAEAPAGLLAPVMRAIDLSGLATGALRPIASAELDRTVMLSALSVIAPGPDALVLGMARTALRDAHHAYFRPDLLGDDVVDRMLALQPGAAVLREAWRLHRQRGPVQIKLTGLEADCSAPPRDAARAADCAWWQVVSNVGDDIWGAMERFAATPTLTDHFSAEQAHAIYRFGQYLVYLQSPRLRQALANARKAKGLPGA